MPTYEYECPTCKKTFETIQKITEEPLKICVLCGSEGVRRLISATAFHLKGSGWYKTDYSSGGTSSGSSSPTNPASSSSEKGSGEKSSGEKSGETKTEKTPASSTESKPTSDNTSTKSSSGNSES